MPRARPPMRRSATSRKPIASTACSTGASPRLNTSLGPIRSPTWPRGLGSRASSGTRWTCTNIQTCCAGIRRSPSGPPSLKATMCPSSSPASPCRLEERTKPREGSLMQKKATFSGVIAPVLTPYGEDGGPDAERFVEHCQWLMATGCTALAPFGTTSEGNSLGLDERMELLEELVDSGQLDAAKLMPGTGTCALSDAVVLTKHAIDLGCGGVLMLPPFYYKAPSEEGLFRFFADVIEEVADNRLKIYLY